VVIFLHAHPATRGKLQLCSIRNGSFVKKELHLQDIRTDRQMFRQTDCTV